MLNIYLYGFGKYLIRLSAYKKPKSHWVLELFFKFCFTVSVLLDLMTRPYVRYQVVKYIV